MTPMPRRAAVGRLALGTLALPLCCLPLFPHDDAAPKPPAYRSVVVDSQCVDGRVVEAIDDGNPAGWLAQNTGERC